jgi:hypothetical protein
VRVEAPPGCPGTSFAKFVCGKFFFKAARKVAAVKKPPPHTTNSTVNEGKIMRRTLSAAVLVLAFCCPVPAGVIHNPPPETAPLSEGAVLPSSEAETPGAETAESGLSVGLTEVAFELLAVLPALL